MRKLKLPALQLSILLSLCMQAEAKSYRDPEVVRAWRKDHPCPVAGPGTCFQKGYAVDHVIALECGGADAGYNLAWFNNESHKIKTRYDNARCKNTLFGAIMRAFRFVKFWEK